MFGPFRHHGSTCISVLEYNVRVKLMPFRRVRRLYRKISPTNTVVHTRTLSLAALLMFVSKHELVTKSQADVR